MNWFKKQFEKFSSKLNDDDPIFERNADENHDHPNQPGIRGIQNIEELKEQMIEGINRAAGMLRYSNATIAGITFHSAFADNTVENVGLQQLAREEDFLNRLKRNFKAKGISFKESLKIELVTASENMSRATRIMNGVGVELHTPGNSLKTFNARIIATEGITWEREYILEPTGKQYFIGRCKDPKIESGPKIHNDIAFIGMEEMDDPKYRINSHISRSHASIVFDNEIGAYKIYRSGFLKNPSHKLKIYNPSLNDYTGVSLNQSAIPHLLKHGDIISFNDEITLEFTILS